MSFIDKTNCALIVIDAQPGFFDIMKGDQEAIMRRLVQIFYIADWLNIPCVTTFEKPIERKGCFPPQLEECFSKQGKIFFKTHYDLCLEDEINQHIKGLNKKQMIVCGSETDVCVLLSVLGLKKQGYEVFLIADACFTSAVDPSLALTRMAQEGITLLSTKTFYFEITRNLDEQQWPHGERERFHHFKDKIREELLD